MNTNFNDVDMAVLFNIEFVGAMLAGGCVEMIADAFNMDSAQ